MLPTNYKKWNDFLSIQVEMSFIDTFFTFCPVWTAPRIKFNWFLQFSYPKKYNKTKYIDLRNRIIVLTVAAHFSLCFI